MGDRPSRENLLAVCPFARRFDEPSFVAGEWISMEPNERWVPQISYWRPSEDAARWMVALHEQHIIVSFDWTEPGWAKEMRRITEEPSRLEPAKLLTIRKVLTTLTRAERFCEGSLAQAFERGVPQAAMRRLRVLTASK